MRVRYQGYFEAALDRIEDARLLHENAKYVSAHYLAGVAVECMLRAYAARSGEPFDERHDLRKWYEAARFDEVVAPKRREQIDTALNIVVTQWSNSQRYFSSEMFSAFLHRAGLDRGMRGDVLKERSRRMWNASSDIVTEGRLRWKT